MNYLQKIIDLPSLSAWVLFSGLLGFTSLATAFEISGTLTADNHYGLYVGSADASDLTLIGRNEFGHVGDPGRYNWVLPETHNFDIAEDQYLYVLAWDDGGPQSWIGQFTLPDGSKLYSGIDDWVSTLGTGAKPGPSDPLPTLGTVANDIINATWQTPGAEAANGTAPWGSISGLDATASFLWHDGFGDWSESLASDQTYAIFRSQDAIVAATSVPIPGTVLLLLGGLMVIKRRRF